MISTISSDVGTEYTNLNTYAADANTMAGYVYAASNAAASGSTTYATLKNGIDTAVTTFNSLYDTIDNMDIKTSSMTDHKAIMKFITYGIGIGVLGKLF